MANRTPAQLDSQFTRRRLLRLAGAAGIATGLSGCATPFETDAEPDEPAEIELEGHTSGWIGRRPDSIEDEENPTLELTVGRTYDLVWENADGQPHNFEILDGDGEVLVETDVVGERGESQSVSFEASEEMVAYHCGPHPTSMRGEIDLDEPRPDDDEPTPDPDSVEFAPQGPTVGLETVAEGLTYPTAVAAPDDGSDRVFVTDQLGEVYVIESDGFVEEPILDVSDRLVDVGLDPMDGFDERGLIGIEFHPEFADNGLFYLRYSAPTRPETPDGFQHVEVLSEFEMDEGDVDDDERIVMEIPQPSFAHNSGNVLFGPDGYLYVPTGDGGGAIVDRPDDWYEDNDGGYGQLTTETLLGGILRIDVDGREDSIDETWADEVDGVDGDYAIPPDNPLVDEDGHLDEYYAWGFRNPWGSSFDGDDLYVADVGELLFEIVTLVERGGNYGWNVKEGTHCFSNDSPNDPPEDCPDETPDDVRGGEPLLDPVIEYPQVPEDEQIGSAVIGGGVYRGESIPDLDGLYVFGDWSAEPHGDPAGSLFVAGPDLGDDAEVHPYYEERGVWPIQKLGVEAESDVADNGDLNRYVVALGRDADGELYVTTTETSAIEGDTGAVHRIVPADD